MWFKKKKKEPVIPKPVYEDISELFDELYEKMVIIEKATDELDSKLTNEYTGRARVLRLIFFIGSRGDYKYYYDKLVLGDLTGTYSAGNINDFPVGYPIKDAVHGFIIGKHTFGRQMVDNNITEVYTGFKKLEEHFPAALKVLFKLN